MLRSGLLDRSALQCHDLATCASRWAREYRGAPAGSFHFGSRNWSYSANVGYFIAGDRIVSRKKNGQRVGEWQSLSAFLRDELRASEALELELDPPP